MKKNVWEYKTRAEFKASGIFKNHLSVEGNEIVQMSSLLFFRKQCQNDWLGNEDATAQSGHWACRINSTMCHLIERSLDQKIDVQTGQMGTDNRKNAEAGPRLTETCHSWGSPTISFDKRAPEGRRGLFKSWVKSPGKMVSWIKLSTKGTVEDYLLSFPRGSFCRC